MTSNKESIAIIGGGPAGCACAYFISKNHPNHEVVIFEALSPLHTLLYTGGGRCNLAYAEYDFKDLVKYYPRGEKFLYSVFSQFTTSDTINFFNEIGVETYTQDDNRIFPTTDSAKETRNAMLKSLKKCIIKKEKVVQIYQDNNLFHIQTNNTEYTFNKVIIAIGGHSGYALAKMLGHKIMAPKPALTGLITKENFKHIQGLSLKNVTAEVYYKNNKPLKINDDILFTHEGISGPLAYKISSYFAREDYSKENPISIKLNLLHGKTIDMQSILNANSKKDIKNVITEFIPKSMAEYILKSTQINPEEKCCNINGKTRDLIFNYLNNFEITVTNCAKEGEIVTSGGVDLNEINPKTMESKITKNLYFCGEVMDIDGLCGGFNLQNCWSTGFVAAILN